MISDKVTLQKDGISHFDCDDRFQVFIGDSDGLGCSLCLSLCLGQNSTDDVSLVCHLTAAKTAGMLLIR